ncbi:phosphomannomutase/phosphoglucomutase [mine drainage metagenome]|uniref:Phosphomannomutase/phosphoglucomutase n=1 Tax=mine drainage metagenome TaxID=410659 RepID=A0A1J5PTX4_9ZZZZ
MFPKPKSVLVPNTYAFESEPMVKATGFREYDARWLFSKEINLMGVQALGMGLGALIAELGVKQEVVTGHDFRGYSASIKYALISGLQAAGCKVHDIGLCMTPMAYFAREHLGIDAVAMVTASHNPNGWTGVKMGFTPPLTHGTEEMAELRDIVLGGHGVARPGGALVRAEGVRAAYIDDLCGDFRLSRPLKVVCATGNGTAGAFAPEILARLGCEVVPLHTALDYTFPAYNPNPEAMEMLHDMAAAVTGAKADIALGFDGDGDRCGVVDDEGVEVFADKVGVILARDFAALYPGAMFVADVKSTGLFATDLVLKSLGATTDYWKTGHSHMKRRVHELGALAGFEKSGHYFIAAPIGRGYDCGMRVAVEIVKLMDRHPGQSFSDLRRALPMTYAMPTLSPYCPDTEKYQVLDRTMARLETLRTEGGTLGGRKISGIVTVNGARVMLENGAWGLVRASSNTPNLVVVCESPESEAELRAIFADLDAVIRQEPEVGDYDQTF